MGAFYSNSAGNPWHGEKPNQRRKLNTSKKVVKTKVKKSR